jgi:hypothetical protein
MLESVRVGDTTPRSPQPHFPRNRVDQVQGSIGVPQPDVPLADPVMPSSLIWWRVVFHPTPDGGERLIEPAQLTDSARAPWPACSMLPVGGAGIS